ncbi:MAG: SH3 domain-containing protein [Aristaeellaceae bacterium]
MNIRRWICLFTALLMTMLLWMPASHAESVEDVVVVSAPLRRAADVQDGMVRVWLESIGDVSQLDITVTGRYSVNGNTALTLTDGQTVSIGFNKATGEITLTMNGLTYAVGSEMRLRRHQANGESALSIAQASRPKNLYPGDLQLLAVKQSNGTYRLYPIVHVYIEYYLKGVVPYEMSSSFPIEALKAQAVAARTYTMRAMNARASYNYDLRDTAADQVYYGYTGSVSNATKAVDDTKGIVVMNNGALTGTYYTASNGGQTESVKNAWGSSGYAYLKVKDDPFDALNTSSNRRRLTVYSDFDHPSQKAALASILTEKAKALWGADAVIQTIHSITPHTPKYAAPSRLYTKLDFEVTVLVGGASVKKTLSFDIFADLESPLSMSINGGQNELWSVTKADEGFQIVVGRWGHGIGMSQRGAQQMARMGYTYDQVLGFYYEGCERVQYTFTHSILSAGGSNPVISTEPPADITPAEKDRATVSLPGVSDVAPLRYTASDSGKILIGVPNGSVVTVLYKGTDWSLVRYGEINGYLSTSALVFSGIPSGTKDDVPTMITVWGVVSGANSLNFRSGPGYGYEIQTELAQGTVLCILDTVGEWAKVQYGSRVGYVSAEFLTIHHQYPDQTSGNSTAMVRLENVNDTAPLLASPSTSATVVTRINHGIQVTVLTNDGSWCRVKVAGQEGYLLTSQLDFSATGTTPTQTPGSQGMTAIVNSNASTLNLREGPSTDHDIVAQIPKGTTITVTGYGDTWCAVRWGELSGYVMTKYLLFSQETPSVSPSASASPTPTPTPTSTPSPSPSSKPGETTAWVMRTVNYVNLRETASTEGKVITKIPAGDEVTVLEKGGTFTYVRHGVGTGYVLSKHLTYTKPLESIGILYVNTVSDPLAMRDQPKVSGSKILTYVPRGEKVLLIEELDGWCRVQYGDHVGYCAATYLSRTRPNEYEADDTPIYDPSLAAVTGLSAVVHTDGLALPLRQWCASDAPELATVPDGATVKLRAKGQIWCKISFEGKEGYCLTEKLTLPAE